MVVEDKTGLLWQPIMLKMIRHLSKDILLFFPRAWGCSDSVALHGIRLKLKGRHRGREERRTKLIQIDKVWEKHRKLKQNTELFWSKRTSGAPERHRGKGNKEEKDV